MVLLTRKCTPIQNNKRKEERYQNRRLSNVESQKGPTQKRPARRDRPKGTSHKGPRPKRDQGQKRPRSLSRSKKYICAIGFLLLIFSLGKFFINDVTHFLRFLSPLPVLSTLLNRFMN